MNEAHQLRNRCVRVSILRLTHGAVQHRSISIAVRTTWNVHVDVIHQSRGRSRDLLAVIEGVKGGIAQASGQADVAAAESGEHRDRWFQVRERERGSDRVDY